MFNYLPKNGSWIFALCDIDERRYVLIKNMKKKILSNVIEREINDDTIIHLYVWNDDFSLRFTYIPTINDNANYITSNRNFYNIMKSLWLPLILFCKNRHNVNFECISR